MCGIAGIVSKGASISPSQLAVLAKGMADKMRYRGPDGDGVWVDPDGRCALSHRRLSIIDLTAGGAQPMLAQGGKCAITYNGEFYNFLELKPELERLGAVFHSRSDTEVLLAGLHYWGTGVLDKMDAMFAFGYYDSATKELILARDIFGEKPLYYVDTDKYFAFSSELHTLQDLPGFDCSVDIETIGAYLAFQYVPAPQTIYRSARKLPPGCFLRLRAGQPPEVQRYFRFQTGETRTAGRSLDDLADELEEILVTSLRRRLISDVPLGAFLSGGVDSSTMAALVRKRLNLPLNTFSIGFKGHAESEHFDAAEIAGMLGCNHHEQVLEGYAIDLGNHIGAVLDEPNGDSSCVPTYLVSRHARQRVTVVLSGDGGDEMFGGYGRYFVTVDEDDGRRAGQLRYRNWTAGENYISSRLLVYTDNDVAGLLGEVPPGLQSRLAGMRQALNADQRPLINALREIDAANYMPGAVLAKVDRMSMQHSLEVRAPLLGRDVAKFAAGLAGESCYGAGQGKLVLKRVTTRYLPESWVNRPKRGFGIPIHLWDKAQLLPATRALLESREARLPQWIDRGRIADYLDGFERNFHAYQCWSLFILETWLRAHRAEPAEAAKPVETKRVGALRRWFAESRMAWS
ncbi:MAG TPA: asparagine synthase (glutamine-hydrolyzing) [Stellaceae bacterium]|nr:asparagine synthase (glutamine-hydrolyzing) [Stellaceae bacterium]